jgi:hypothetical protein
MGGWVDCGSVLWRREREGGVRRTYDDEEVAGAGFGDLVVGTEEPEDLVVSELATFHL